MGGEYSARLAAQNAVAQAELEARGLTPAGKEWRGNPPLHTFNRAQRRFDRMTLEQLVKHFGRDEAGLKKAVSVRSTRRRGDFTAQSRVFTALIVESRRRSKQIVATAQAARRAANRDKKEAASCGV